MTTPMFCATCGQPRTDYVSPCVRCGQPGPYATAGPAPVATPGYPPTGSVPGYASTGAMPGAVGPAPIAFGVPVSAGPSSNPITAIFDFKFDRLVTPMLLRFFYAFFVIVWSLMALLWLIIFLVEGGFGVIIGLIVVPISYAISIIWLRVSFELIASFFRLTEDLRAIRTSKGV